MCILSCFLIDPSLNAILLMPLKGSLLPKVCTGGLSYGTKASLGQKNVHAQVLNCMNKFRLQKYLHLIIPYNKFPKYINNSALQNA